MAWALCSANVAFVKTTMFFDELPSKSVEDCGSKFAEDCGAAA